MNPVVVFLFALAHASGGKWLEEASKGNGGECMMRHCGGLVFKCGGDTVCRSNLMCHKACGDKLPTDKSPGKVDFQNCTMECGYELDSVLVDEVMTCVNAHECMALPRINYPGDPFFNKCAPDSDILHDASLSQEDLKGTWWASAGFNPIYDCSFSCQHTSLETVNQTELVWKLDMDVPLHNGSRRALHENWPLPVQKGAVFWMNHTDMGLEHIEHWFLMGKGNGWVALYYCGQSGNDAGGWWVYSGGILFTREPALPHWDLPSVERAYKRAGFTMDNACTMDNSKCTKPALPLVIV